MISKTSSSQNRAFMEMRKPALARLAGRSAKDIAQKAGVIFDAERSEFYLVSLNQEIRISYPQYEMKPDIDEWHHLLILHYLDLADGTLPGENLINFSQLKDGLIRGGGFDRQCEQTISKMLQDQPPERLRQVFESMGAKILSSNADLCAEFSFFPFYPVTLKIWFADEEFPCSGRMLLNENADHCLTTEDAVTAGSLILDRMSAGLQS